MMPPASDAQGVKFGCHDDLVGIPYIGHCILHRVLLGPYTANAKISRSNNRFQC
jgi:hypothetical protein